VLEPLAPHRRVHVIDLPRLRRPSGPCDFASWLGRWLHAAGLERADVAGHSLGGLVAAELAAAEPERVRRLVLVGPAGIPCGRGLARRALPLAGTLYDIRRSLPMVVPGAVRAGPGAVARGIAFVSTRDLRDELSAVRAPTLLVWGERDRLVPPSLAEEWQRLLPGSRLERLPCGHVPMLEAPRELAACMLAFLDDELADDPGDQLRTGVVDGVGLARHDDEPAAR
jgi:pimeloyl-ACP methyl ester carboxylesterase